MNRPKYRLTEPATLYVKNPHCGACYVETEWNGDGYVCPDCGTFWPGDAEDEAPGTPYADWSGEDVDDLPLVKTDEAFLQ